MIMSLNLSFVALVILIFFFNVSIDLLNQFKNFGNVLIFHENLLISFFYLFFVMRENKIKFLKNVNVS